MAEITTASELLNADPTEDHVIKDDLDASGISDWVFGTYSGVMDGQEHTITGIDANSSSQINLGFVGTNNGTIKNLNLVNGDVDLSVTSSYDSPHSAFAGAVVGKNNGTIENVHVDNYTVRISASYLTPDGYYLPAGDCGGIAGKSDGTIRRCSITNSSINGSSYVGALYTNYNAFNGGTIRNSYCHNVILNVRKSDQEDSSEYEADQALSAIVFREGLTAENCYVSFDIDSTPSGTPEYEYYYKTSTSSSSSDGNTVLNGYYNNSKNRTLDALNTKHNESSDGITVNPLTEAEMTGSGASDNFDGYDFTDVWRETDSFPELIPDLVNSAMFFRGSNILVGDYGGVFVFYGGKDAPTDLSEATNAFIKGENLRT